MHFPFFFFFMIYLRFVDMRLFGTKNFKTVLLYQIAFEFFQTYPTRTYPWMASQECCFEFLKFWVSDFNDFVQDILW